MRSTFNPFTRKPDYYGAAPDEIIDAKTESLIEVRNDGIAMTRAQLGYASNVSGHRVIIKPALASVAGQAAGTLGFTTTALDTNTNGYVINFGVLEDVATNVDSEGNALSVGDIIYLSASVAGGFTKIPPASPYRRRVGSIMEAHNTQGKILVELPPATSLSELTDAGNPTDFNTGFEDPDGVGVSYDRAERKITLTHSSGTIAWYYRGTRYTTASPWTSAAHTNSTNTYWLTINGAITAAAWSTSVWAFTDVMAANVRYDLASAANTFSLRETHGTMPWQDHQEFHDTVGTYWKSGLGITAGTTVVYTNSTAPTDVADNTPGVDVGVIKDEDLQTTIPALTQGTYTTAYRSGASGDWVFNVAATTPYFVGTNTLQYNQWTGATWQLTVATEDAFVNVFDFAIPVASDADSQKYRHVWITGQTLHTTLAAAQAEQPSALSLGTLQSLFAEATCVNRITYQFNAVGVGSVGAGVSGRCKIMSQDPIRGTSRNQVAVIGSTPVLSVLPATSITVDATGFDGNLAPTDDTVQKALQKFDDFSASATASSTSVVTTNFKRALTTSEDTVQKALNRLEKTSSNSTAELAVRAVSTWAEQASPDCSWFSVCWSPELGLFCAVGYSGIGNNGIMTSSNGTTWTARTSTADNYWYSVCWSSELGLFCAVAWTGTGNRVMTSPDGINWTARNTTGKDNDWRSVCWSPELGLFCAVSDTGTGNRVMTSPDGITWTTRTSAADNSWRSVCWSPELGLFCAVGYSGTGNRVMTSPDGITWTTRTSAADNSWRSVCWSPELGLFCAVSSTGTGNRVMTSPDGITWTTRTSAADSSWNSVCWSSELGLFCAVTDTGTIYKVMTSPNGINWTIRTSVNSTCNSVCWSSELGLFCVVSTTSVGRGVVTSKDVGVYKPRKVVPKFFYRSAIASEALKVALKWYTRLNSTNNNWTSVCWSPELGLLCAVSSSGTGNRVMTSPDGITWTTRTSATDNAWNSVCWSSELGLLCAVSTNGTDNQIMTSPDGITWTTRVGAIGLELTSVCWSPELGLFCAVGWSSDVAGNSVITSPDGINWTVRTSAADNYWYSVCWSPERRTFCAVAVTGFENSVMRSSDGENWNAASSAPDNEWRSVCWSPELGLFCAVASSGTGNRVMTSPDGANWTARNTTGKDNNWYSVCWSSELGLFCAVAQSGTGNRVMTSPDGVNWTLRTSATDTTWSSVCWSPELWLFCAVSSSGTNNRVMTSRKANLLSEILNLKTS
jgi:hypothetical protein